MIALNTRTPEAKRAYFDGFKTAMEMAAKIADAYMINAQRRAADHRQRGAEEAMRAAMDKMEAGIDIAANIRENAKLHEADGQSEEK